jgi:hypothetical protein
MQARSCVNPRHRLIATSAEPDAELLFELDSIEVMRYWVRGRRPTKPRIATARGPCICRNRHIRGTACGSFATAPQFLGWLCSPGDRVEVRSRLGGPGPAVRSVTATVAPRGNWNCDRGRDTAVQIALADRQRPPSSPMPWPATGSLRVLEAGLEPCQRAVAPVTSEPAVKLARTK